MSGQSVKRGAFRDVLRAIGQMFTARGFLARKASPEARPEVGYSSPAKRVRVKGSTSRAGAKLARMAAEGRLTIRKGW